MSYAVFISNKISGKVWDITKSVTSVELESHRAGAPGRLSFEWIKSGDVSFFEGDVVRFEVDGVVRFFGWVFTKEKNRWDYFSVTCYDRLRYLKNQGSYAFYGRTAGEIIREIAEDLELDVSELEDTGYQIPSLVMSNQACMDIIQYALNMTLLNTGIIYVLYDDGQGLALRNSADWKSEYILGDRSYVTDYTYKTDIDESTYNYIQLTFDDAASGSRKAVVAEDSANMARWGQLKYYQDVNGDYNLARLQDMAQNILSSTNRRKRTFTCSALGIPSLRAGMMLRFKIEALGDISLDKYILIETVTHHFANDEHTMDIETIDL